MSKRYERDNYTQTVLANVASIPGEILVYGFTVYNSKNAAQFIQLFDDGYGTPADGVTPAVSYPVASDAVLTVYYGPSGRLCKGGLTLANSTTGTTKTAGVADCLFDIQYAHVFEEG